jgi:hypothetical protein
MGYRDRFGNHSRGSAWQIQLGVREIRILSRRRFRDDCLTTPAERLALRRLVSKGILDRIANSQDYALTPVGEHMIPLLELSGHIRPVGCEETELPPVPAGDFDEDDPFGIAE